jgi:hypothetical protein
MLWKEFYTACKVASIKRDDGFDGTVWRGDWRTNPALPCDAINEPLGVLIAWHLYII